MSTVHWPLDKDTLDFGNKYLANKTIFIMYCKVDLLVLFTQHQQVKYAWLVECQKTKVELRYSTTALGERSVMTTGVLEMLMLSVVLWVYQMQQARLLQQLLVQVKDQYGWIM